MIKSHKEFLSLRGSHLPRSFLFSLSVKELLRVAGVLVRNKVQPTEAIILYA